MKRHKLLLETKTTTTGLEEYIDIVFNDRRMVLAFGYKRRCDVKRGHLGQKVFLGINAREPHPYFDPTRDYLFLLLARELDVNPDLGLQNPGYLRV